MRSPALNAIQAVCTGADAGLYELPADIVALRTALQRLVDEASRPSEVRSAGAVGDDLADEFLDAAASGADWPSLDRLLEAERDDRAHAHRLRILTSVAQRAADSLAARVSGDRDLIVTEYLRPAMAELMQEAAATVDAFVRFGDDPEQLLRAPAKAREAWSLMDLLATRYGAIRTAQDALRRAGAPPQYDVTNRFGEFGNVIQLWNTRNAREAPPWPSALRARLVWAVQHGAEVWVPTVAEQDEAWDVAFGKQRQHA